MGVKTVRIKGQHYTAVNDDCVVETSKMADNSVGLIVTSIPFSNHYEYTPTYNDFGHNLDNDKFADILMKQINFWGEDLSAIHDSSGTSFKNIIVNHLNKISEIGIKKYIDELVS